MQTTLLGIAIALILALLAALVGPYFVDWSQYRDEFATQATRLTGLTVRVTGPAELRLLPTPTLTLQQIEISRPGDAGAMRAKSLGIEFALGPLLRGEWRASDVRLEGADFAIRIDESGRLDWPAPTLAVDPDAFSIERFDIVDSRVLLADATSGSHLLLEKIDFRGEMRSLAGPIKGEGAVVIAGHHYPYRISASRAGEAGVRVRLNVDPIDRPLIAEGDAQITVEGGVPRFDGSWQIARPVGRSADGIIEPWRLSSRIRGDSSAAVLEQIEFQYGPDERAIKLRGEANLVFGRSPQLTVGLASTQVDLDRMLGLPEPARKRPFVAVKSFADFFGGAQRPPIPVKLGISVENVMLAGATLQRVTGEVKTDADNWNLDVLDFRAPGATQVGLSGRLNVTEKGIDFDGRAKVEARDPRALVAWLSDRVDLQTLTPGLFRAEGDVELGNDRIAIDGLTAELDRMTLAGRLAYSWAKGGRPPRIEAALSAPEIDIDRAYALARGIFDDATFDWPREGKLALKVERAAVAGVEVRQADVNMQFDGRGLEIERLAIGDFGGAALGVKGRIDTRAPAPRGVLTLDLDARALDGVAAALDAFAPKLAAEFRRRAPRFVPAKVHAALSVGADGPRAGAQQGTSFKVEGSAGTFNISLQGGADRASEALTIDDLWRLGDAKLNVAGRLDAGEGAALIELLGLDSIVAADKRPGRLNFTASGALNGQMTVDGRLVAGGLDVASKGAVRLSGSQGPTADLTVRVANATLRSPRPVTGARADETVPVVLSAKVALAEGVIGLNDIVGKVAGTDIGGRLKIGLAQPLNVDGDIDLADVELPAVIAAALGTPLQPRNGSVIWPAEPFEQGIIGGIGGRVAVRVAVRVAHVALTPKLAAKNVRAMVQFDRSELAVDEISGTFAGGRIAGDIGFERGAEGVTARARLNFAAADLTELIRGGPPPLTGRVTLGLIVEGTGRSPAALIGALKGGGTFTMQDGRAIRLDPAAFDAVIRSVDQGLPIDGGRIRERMEQALNAGGTVSIPLAEGEIAVAGGQVRLTNTIVRAERAELVVSGSGSLTEDAVDVKLTLSATEHADASGGTRPEISVALKGPMETPKRTLDVTVFANWLALRAVDQQAKRVDALESGRELPVPPSIGSNASSPPPAATPPVARPPRAVRTDTPPRRRIISPNAGQAPPRPLDLRPPLPVPPG